MLLSQQLYIRHANERYALLKNLVGAATEGVTESLTSALCATLQDREKLGKMANQTSQYLSAAFQTYVASPLASLKSRDETCHDRYIQTEHTLLVSFCDLATRWKDLPSFQHLCNLSPSIIEVDDQGKPIPSPSSLSPSQQVVQDYEKEIKEKIDSFEQTLAAYHSNPENHANYPQLLHEQAYLLKRQLKQFFSTLEELLPAPLSRSASLDLGKIKKMRAELSRLSI